MEIGAAAQAADFIFGKKNSDPLITILLSVFAEI